MVSAGLVDYDWSNAKLEWANEGPMDCDGSLVRQAARNKAQNPTAKVFVYLHAPANISVSKFKSELVAPFLYAAGIKTAGSEPKRPEI
eukprot:COSAG06_NODE_9486_length_1888_cov_6.752935_3_plen_88_part_00